MPRAAMTSQAWAPLHTEDVNFINIWGSSVARRIRGAGLQSKDL